VRAREPGDELAVELGAPLLVAQLGGGPRELVALRARLVAGLGQLLLALLELDRLHLELGVLRLELVAALRERPCHRVERCPGPSDLVAAALGDGDVELAAADTLRSGREPPDRQHDPARDEHGRRREREDARAEPDDRDQQRAPRRVVGGGRALRRQGLLGRGQRGDPLLERLGPRAAFGGGREVAPGADAVLARARDHRVGVVVDVGQRLVADPRRAARALRVRGHERLEVERRVRERRARLAVGLQELVVAADQVAADARLDGEQPLLAEVGGGDHRLRAPGGDGGVVLVADRERQRGHGRRDDRDEDGRADDRPGGEAVPHAVRS
jgi:hypothetical protein